MNKKILTVAVGAALAAGFGAVAQADVKLYGAAQVEINSTNAEATNKSTLVKTDTGNVTAADKKRGRIGVAADEDLGNGMKGLAKFEWNVDTSDNVDNTTCTANPTSTTCTVADSFSARDSYVGLQGGFGTVRLGRSGSPYKQSGVALDPFVTTTLEARNNYGMSGNADGYGVLNGHNSFQNTGLWYTTPSMSGFSVDAYLGVDESNNTNGDVSVVAGYKADALNVFAGYNKDSNPGTAAEPNAMKVGAQFKAGDHSIALQWEATDNDATGASNKQGNYLFAGYQGNFGKLTAVAQAGKFSGEGDDEATYYVLGAIYNMSKTFRIFGGYRSTDATLFVAAPTSVYVQTETTVYTVGMRKDF